MVDEEKEDADESPLKPRQIDRERGILTSHDRAYLLGEKELDDQDERNARYRIRQRTIQAIYDMHLISNFVSFDDMKQISDEVEEFGNTAPIRLAYNMIRADDRIADTFESFEEYVAYVAAVESAPDVREPETTSDSPQVLEVEASAEIEIDHNEIPPKEIIEFEEGMSKEDKEEMLDNLIKDHMEVFRHPRDRRSE